MHDPRIFVEIAGDIYIIGKNQKLHMLWRGKPSESALRRSLLSKPMQQIWAYAVIEDATYRAKKDTGDLGAACSKGSCDKCVFYDCKHECHKDQQFVDPITEDGKWKGLKHFAWVPI